MIEYEDWHELSPADAARMLFERFHHLLMVLHMSNEIPSDVSLFSIDNRPRRTAAQNFKTPHDLLEHDLQ